MRHPSANPSVWGCHCFVWTRGAKSGRKNRSAGAAYDQLLQEWRRLDWQQRGWRQGAPRTQAKKGRPVAAPWAEEPPRGFAAGSSPSGHQRHQGGAVASKHARRARRARRGDGRFPAGLGALDEDELHNLHFEGAPSGGKQRRRSARRGTRQRRGAAASPWQGFAGGGIWYGGAAYAQGSHWETDSDPESDSEYADCAFGGGGGGGGRAVHQDWRWWDDAQERAWYEEVWKTRGTQQDRGYGSAWWQHFRTGSYSHHQQQQQQQQDQHRQQQQQQHQHQHQQQEWQQRSGAGGGLRFPSPAVLEQLRVLQLPQDLRHLDRRQLKVAFHRLAMTWHPDRHADPASKAAAEAKFKAAKEAYESLVTLCPC